MWSTHSAHVEPYDSLTTTQPEGEGEGGWQGSTPVSPWGRAGVWGEGRWHTGPRAPPVRRHRVGVGVWCGVLRVLMRVLVGCLSCRYRWPWVVGVVGERDTVSRWQGVVGNVTQCHVEEWGRGWDCIRGALASYWCHGRRACPDSLTPRSRNDQSHHYPQGQQDHGTGRQQ